jgi:hypothetical protein
MRRLAAAGSYASQMLGIALAWAPDADVAKDSFLRRRLNYPVERTSAKGERVLGEREEH